MPGTSALAELVATVPSILVGYSGGVDSALLAVVARRVLGREQAVSALGLSASYPAVQHRQAREIASAFDLELVEVATGELADPRYLANPTNRCYYCKSALWSRLAEVARERSLAVVADGTNLDDLGEHRPGLLSSAEWGVRSLLVEAGYTKAAVREEARRLGIPVWDAPAAPCLSSRVMYGLTITPDRLRQVEQGEQVLRHLGVGGDLRVRHRGSEARIEIAPAEFGRVRAHRSDVASRFLALGFSRVTLDLDGYRRGKLLESGEPRLELLAESA